MDQLPNVPTDGTHDRPSPHGSALKMTDSQSAGIVLCAGLGTRLRPATRATPKPAVPFMGKPIARHAFDALAAAGIGHFGANFHYYPDVMEAALEPVASRAGATFAAAWEDDEILGTGGGLRGAWAAVGRDRPVVLCHGDVILGLDLAPVVEAHRASGRALTLVLKVRDESMSLRGAFTDATGRLTRLIDAESPTAVHPQVEHAFTGIHVIEPEVFDLLPSDGFSCLVTEVYPRMLRAGLDVGAHLTTAFYADLGTYDRYLAAQRAVFDEPGRLQGLEWPAERMPGVFADETVVIEPGATIVGPVRLEQGVRVRRGAEVGPYVAATGTIEFGSASRVSNASLFGSGHVNRDVRDTLLAVEEAEASS